VSAADNAAAAARLRDELDHYDPTQLVFQLQEIVVDASYLRHGVEVGPGDIVLDVGANAGVAGAFFASVCGAGAVHSFEPVPELFELLERNLGRYPACTCHPYGLGRSPGPAQFTFYPGAAAMSGLYADPEADRAVVRTAMINLGSTAEAADADLAGRYAAQPVTGELRTLSAVLAELGLDRVDLLKIDVEKAELDVLAGLDPGDWPRIRQLVVEVHDVEGRLGALRGELEGRGFRVATAQDRAFRGTPIHALYAVR
jgi:FkbM family methyltransferase